MPAVSAGDRRTCLMPGRPLAREKPELKPKADRANEKRYILCPWNSMPPEHVLASQHIHLVLLVAGAKSGPPVLTESKDDFGLIEQIAAISLAPGS
jgi:hypothetical protein